MASPVPLLAAAPASTTAPARAATTATAANPKPCAACWGTTAPSIGKTVNTVINHLFNSTFNWLSTLPGGPITNLIEGSLVLLRRSLFLSPSGVTASQSGSALDVAVNTGSVAYFRQDGTSIQVSGDPGFWGAKKFNGATVSTVAVTNSPGSAGCAGVVVESGTITGDLTTSQIDAIRFGTGAAFSNKVTATMTGGPLTLRDAVRGLGGVTLNAAVVLADDVEVDAGDRDASFGGTVDAAKQGKQSLTVTALGATTFDAAVGGQAALSRLLTRGIAPLDITQSADSKTIPLKYLPTFSTNGQAQVKYGIDVAIGNNPSQVYEFDTGGVSFFAGYNPNYWKNVPLTPTAISETYSTGNYYNGVVSNANITLGQGSQTVSTGQPVAIAAILNGGNSNTGASFDFTNPDTPPVEDRFFGDFGASFGTTPVAGLTAPLANPLFQLPGNLSSGFLVQLGPIGIDPRLTVGVTDALRAQFPYAVSVKPQSGGGTYPISGYDILSWFGFAPAYTATLNGVTEQIGASSTLPTLIDSGAPSTGVRIKGQGGDAFNTNPGKPGQLIPGATFIATFPTTAGRPALKWSYTAGNNASVNLVDYQAGAPGGEQNVNTGLNIYNSFDVMFDVARQTIWLRPTGGQATVSLGSVTTTGEQTYQQNAVLGGVYTTGGGDFTVGGSTVLRGNTVVDAGAGDLRFSGTVDSATGAESLAANSGGATTFVREIGSQKKLATLSTDAGGTTNAVSVATSGAQTYSDAAELCGLYAITDGAFSVGGPATLTGPVSVSANTITFSGAIDSAPSKGYQLTLTPGDTALLNGDVGGTNPLGGLTLLAAKGSSASVVVPGSVSLSGDFGFSGPEGLSIGNRVTARLTGGGVIRNFTTSGVVVGESTGTVIKDFTVSGNGSDGIVLTGATDPNLTGNAVLANGYAIPAKPGNGINAIQTSGGLFQSNTIVNNNGSGVVVTTGTGNRILSNSISGNGSGISLTDGGNNAQLAPDQIRATLAGTQMTVDFTVNPAASGSYTVQIFYTPAATAGTVQGQQLLATYTEVPAGSRIKTFAVPSTVAIGGSVTVTETSSSGDTSEFSVSAPVTGAV